MELLEHSYRTLLVSASEKMNDALMTIFGNHHCEPVRIATDIASARRMVLETAFDLIVINTPLPDEFGTRFSVDVAATCNAGVLMLVKAEHYQEILVKTSALGILVISKPTSPQIINQSLDLMCATRERLRRMEQKTATIEEKMEEIRLVNKAKWVLVEQLKMTEPDAHRFIQKSAMDRGESRRQVAESIIRMYQ